MTKDNQMADFQSSFDFSNVKVSRSAAKKLEECHAVLETGVKYWEVMCMVTHF